MTYKSIDKIVKTYSEIKDVDKYSHVHGIEENDFNLNISIYVDTFEESLIISSEIASEIKYIDKEI